MKPTFAGLADEFEARVRAAPITSSTDVALIYHCVDVHGKTLAPVRIPLAPQVLVAGAGEEGEEVAAAVRRDTILANINSLVRHAPEGLIFLRGAPQVPLRIVGFDLDIGPSSAPRIRIYSEDPFGGSLLLPYALLERVRAVLDRSGVRYEVDHHIMSVNGGPPMALINLQRGSEIRKIQAMLENAV